MNSSQKKFTINAFYRGVDDDYYLFEDDEGDNIEFDLCTENVLRKFDLDGTKEVDNYFTLTYRLIDIDEHEEVELELMNMEKA